MSQQVEDPALQNVPVKGDVDGSLALSFQSWRWPSEIRRHSATLIHAERIRCHDVLRELLPEDEFALLKEPLNVGLRLNVRSMVAQGAVRGALELAVLWSILLGLFVLFHLIQIVCDLPRV